jgi:hypothetical protein
MARRGTTLTTDEIVAWIEGSKIPPGEPSDKWPDAWLCGKCAANVRAWIVELEGRVTELEEQLNTERKPT